MSREELHKMIMDLLQLARLEISAGFMGGAHAGFPEPPEE
jgi:hypothetical protein